MKKNYRQINKLLLLDKPYSLSSNKALQICKYLFQASKAGHTGNLDPLATGMLPLCFGRTTKFAQYMLDSDKTYETTLILGQQTTTGDAEGEVIFEKPVPELSKELIESVLEKFRGEIEQCPPMFSALKHNGKPLYEYARKGITIERPKRSVTIYQCDLNSFAENTISLTVKCSKGTYIRTLGEDIGEALGCGASLQSLRRTAAAGFPAEMMVTLDALREIEGDFDRLDQFLVPVDRALEFLPQLSLTAPRIEFLRNGRKVELAHEDVELIRAYDSRQEFIGLCKINEGILSTVKFL